MSIFAITDGVSDVLWLLPLRGGSWNQLGQEHNRTKMATEGDEVLNRKKFNMNQMTYPKRRTFQKN